MGSALNSVLQSQINALDRKPEECFLVWDIEDRTAAETGGQTNGLQFQILSAFLQ